MVIRISISKQKEEEEEEEEGLLSLPVIDRCSFLAVAAPHPCMGQTGGIR